MADVYILYSSELDRYYIGSCLNFEERFKEHLEKKMKNSFSSKADYWTMYYKYEGLGFKQARLIEQHIKNMKSRKFIADIKSHPAIMERLILKYKAD